MPQRMPKDRTQVVPFENANDLHFRIARCFDLLNHWNAALTGQYLFDDVTPILTRQVEALNISIFRYEDGRAHPISTRSRAYDDHKPSASTGSLLAYVLKQPGETPALGRIYRLSKLRDNADFARSVAGFEWNAKPKVIEVGLVILANDKGHVDAIEMTFDRVPSVNPDIPPSLVTTALANAWALRMPGVVSRAINKNRSTRSSVLQSSFILGHENPAALTRAEQRVCHLLADGDSASAISDRLGLSISTVRTHLRNIYSKTETTGQVNLISVIQQQRDEVA